MIKMENKLLCIDKLVLFTALRIVIVSMLIIALSVCVSYAEFVGIAVGFLSSDTTIGYYLQSFNL